MRISILAFAVLAVCVTAAASAAEKASPVTYRLKYTDNFSGKKPDPRYWGRIDKGNPDWCKNMSLRDDLVKIEKGVAKLFGIKNDGEEAGEKRAVLTGGISTKGRFTMLYGKVEARVRFEDQRGAWPAFWMLPEKSDKGWPDAGEIDIFERLNSDSFVYQTVHSGWKAGGPAKGGKGQIKQGDWNVYGLEWTPEELVWTVNGKRTHSYARVSDDPMQYPWTVPFYVLIDQQLGGKWVGNVDESTLPVVMEIDWVKFYDAYRGSKKISRFEFIRKASKAKGESEKRKSP
ncbi:MAG: glycoside hydrolase family 16 protein [Kiritimatiellae bacterium]|nr:glycoside hydrolase family 16 protein [Kiritimatiellia bacterium]